jgi:hypothetical protein
VNRLPDDVERLVNKTEINSVQARLGPLRERLHSAEGRLYGANRALNSAKAAEAHLINRTTHLVPGHAEIQPREILAVADEIRKAEILHAFEVKAISQIQAMIAKSERELRNAEAVAYKPLLEHAADLRIAAAAAADAARQLKAEERDAAFAEAQEQFDQANALLNFALERGVQGPPKIPGRLTTERQERAFWGRPAKGECR